MNFNSFYREAHHKNSFLPVFCIAIFFCFNAYGQKSDGTVNSLVKTDAYFNDLVVKEGLNQAFMELAEKRGVVFKPNPLNILDFYGKQEPADFEWTREPDFAMIAKSGYFGFTSG